MRLEIAARLTSCSTLVPITSRKMCGWLPTKLVCSAVVYGVPLLAPVQARADHLRLSVPGPQASVLGTAGINCALCSSGCVPAVPRSLESVHTVVADLQSLQELYADQMV